MSNLIFSFLSFLIICTNANVSQHNPFYCFSQDPIRPQIGMFATKSTYETNRGQNIDASVSNCNPSKFWLLSRHGTRLPSKSDLGKIFEHNEKLHQGILKNYDAGRSSICASDISLIRNWRFDTNITIEIEQYLTVAGWNELKGLGERFQKAFPTILSNVYSSSDYFFRNTNRQRTLASLRAFADGLFGHNGFEQVLFEQIPDPDFLLRPHDNCPLYDEIKSARLKKKSLLKVQNIKKCYDK